MFFWNILLWSFILFIYIYLVYISGHMTSKSVAELWVKCGRSVAGVWLGLRLGVTDVTDGHKRPTIYWPWLLRGIQG